MTPRALPWVVVARHTTGAPFTSSYHATQGDAISAAQRFELDYPGARTAVLPKGEEFAGRYGLRGPIASRGAS